VLETEVRMADVEPLNELALRHITIHGHRRAYRMAGSGPTLLLLHGLGCHSGTWLPVMPKLAERFTVIAPDLLGHGDSDKPRGDYSLGAYANGMRDLLTLLEVDRVTVVGHSFGGGIAMQFAYQFPERTERVALIDSGGLGPDVSVFIRALGWPVTSAVLSVAGARPLRPLVGGALSALSHTGLPRTRDLAEVADIYRHMLCDAQGRFAVRRVTSSVVDWRGQIVSLADRAYLTQLVPMCVVWGEADDIIPVAHAYAAQGYAPAADIHVIPGSGHFPHKEHPEKVAQILTEFVDSSRPARYSIGRWRRVMEGGDGDVLVALSDAHPEGARPRGRGAATSEPA
jgi:pimeloyl-ACP methyl ester carboxylesterase